MNETVVAFITICVVGWLAIAGARLARKSHQLKKQYKSASETERLTLDAQMKKDPKLRAHMRSLSWTEILLGISVAAVVLAGKATGII